MRYVVNTTVSIEKTQEEIRKLLRKYGSDGFGTSEEDREATIGFRINGIRIRITAILPDRKEKRFVFTGKYGYTRTAEQQNKLYAQAIRQKWRVLLLTIKAKLEAVENQIVTLEEEFMPFIVTETGETIGERLLPRLKAAQAAGQSFRLLEASTILEGELA